MAESKILPNWSDQEDNEDINREKENRWISKSDGQMGICFRQGIESQEYTI